MKILLLCRLWLLFLIPSAAFCQANGKLQIHFMDVGQGDGALLVSPLGETVLFDDGALNNCDKPVSYLQQLGVTKIDYHIASHYHSDHIGCAVQVLHDFPLKKAAYDRGQDYNSSVYHSYVTAVGSLRQTANPGLTITLDAQSPAPVVIKIVSVNASTEDGKVVDTSNENDLSVSSLIHFGNFDAEIGGDLSGYKSDSYEDIETSVAPKVGQIEVYKVHHHGSRYSSNTNWLWTTKPQIGIVSCGDGNRYNHPTAECLEALHKAGIKTYWTETGNGVEPEPGLDVVGGNIIVEVPSDSKTYTVTYQGNKTDQYTVRKTGAAGPGIATVTTATNNSPFASPSYAWSKHAQVYHFVGCKFVQNISPQNLVQGAAPPDGKTLHKNCPQ
jgi:beta-lactamase superfamily II metal-dependent hydrolase